MKAEVVFLPPDNRFTGQRETPKGWSLFLVFGQCLSAKGSSGHLDAFRRTNTNMGIEEVQD